MIDYSAILTLNYKNDLWAVYGNSYDGIEWFSNTPKPTQEELDALWLSTKDAIAKQNCTNQAKTILTATDWTQANDCPLVNKAEFTTYRATVRELAINPVANAVFPELPTEQWN
jgi:hypothetical protein